MLQYTRGTLGIRGEEKVKAHPPKDSGQIRLQRLVVRSNCDLSAVRSLLLSWDGKERKLVLFSTLHAR